MTHYTANDHGMDRRAFMEALALAGIGAAAFASEGELLPATGAEHPFAPGMRVVDAEAATPDQAIVLLTPDVPINDWRVFPGETVADHNPGHDPLEPVVITAFEHKLDAKWPEWRAADSLELFDGVTSRGIKFYAFPASRLA